MILWESAWFSEIGYALKVLQKEAGHARPFTIR